ncbi:hypothetical protein PHYBOEH_010048 [Phytophthora boehmeriae]|uniref:Uncharacterized protein n=1 Tax=Phytophthora boehmeriae TaxID=109152 RepID=A0A8T1X4G5_9STRA|nr:hypothetical protein PHYBOEH_010048 [Phytophthora boehmeriae]
MERRGNGNVSWERFEEKTKLAFVGDPLNSRFFLKTRVTANGVTVVSRVAHQTTKPTPASLRSLGGSEAVKYATASTANLSRLSRLLRFIMQEVLGPMKALPAATPLPLTSKTTIAAPSNTADKKKKKKKAAKK